MKKKHVSYREFIEKWRKVWNPERQLAMMRESLPKTIEERDRLIQLQLDQKAAMLVRNASKAQETKINNMKELNYKLDVNASLFKKLKDNPPVWWTKVKQHPKLYIEIRKDNYINVYYQGGSIAKIFYDEGKIKAESHPAYMDLTYEKGESVNYLDCTSWLETKLDQMLINVEKKYSNKDEKDKNPENISEKKIQSELIINNRNKYLDSEFQHLIETIFNPKENKSENKFIRIDLVKVENNTITFVELKHIKDNRLLNKDVNSEPEIICQMTKYKEFIEANKDKFVEYYTQLHKIKSNLDLPVPNITNLSINTTPELLIIDVYQKLNDRRKNRIANIKQVLERNKIVYNIEKCK